MLPTGRYAPGVAMMNIEMIVKSTRKKTRISVTARSFMKNSSCRWVQIT